MLPRGPAGVDAAYDTLVFWYIIAVRGHGGGEMDDRTGSSRHVEREATVALDGPAGKVFPLFGPIREAEWAEGWNPAIHHRGDARDEDTEAIGAGAVFTHMKGKADSHWLLTTWDQPEGRAEYAVVVPGSWVCRITIRVRATESGRSSATVRYAYTGLDADGLALVDGYSQEAHEERIAGWARAINHYLETGGRLRAPHD